MRFSFPKRHTHIDLLPESAQQQKRFRRLVIKLAALQAAVFLCIGAAWLGVRQLEGQAWDESRDLAARVYALRHGQEVAAAAQAHELALLMAAEEAFLRARAPGHFDPAWVTAIMEAPGGGMTGLGFDGSDFQITGVIEDIAAIEAHRQGILDTGLFAWVELGRINLQGDGVYFYELWARVGR